MKDVPMQKIGGRKVIFGKAMAFEYRGQWCVIVGPSTDAVSEIWYDLHPSVKPIDQENVRDVGVMSEQHIREAFAQTQETNDAG